MLAHHMYDARCANICMHRCVLLMRCGCWFMALWSQSHSTESKSPRQPCLDASSRAEFQVSRSLLVPGKWESSGNKPFVMSQKLDLTLFNVFSCCFLLDLLPRTNVHQSQSRAAEQNSDNKTIESIRFASSSVLVHLPFRLCGAQMTEVIDRRDNKPYVNYFKQIFWCQVQIFEWKCWKYSTQSTCTSRHEALQQAEAHS